MTTTLLLAGALGYLLGSIPFGLLLTRAAGVGDIRSIGSGNIGATNVLRTGNKKLAAATLLLDALKGTAAVLIAFWLIGIPSGFAVAASLAAGLGAFVGHIFPVWLDFKGGKGVATFIGVLLGLWWPLALVFCATWLAVAFLSRYSSLSALIAAVVTPIAAMAMGARDIGMLASVMSVLLIWKHSANISRLAAGTEPKIGAKDKA